MEVGQKKFHHIDLFDFLSFFGLDYFVLPIYFVNCINFIQEARKQLEEQQDELRGLMTKLEADRNMELDERQKLEEEIRKKQEVPK